MKKKFLLLSVLSAAVLILASCGKESQSDSPSVQETTKPVPQYVTDAEGGRYYPVTDADGNATRNGDGNLLVYATDSDGNPVEGKTEAANHGSALIIGRYIEMPEYRIVIPDGWSDARSYNEISIGNPETLDMIFITQVTDMTYDEKVSDTEKLLESVKRRNKNAVISSEKIQVGGEEAVYMSGRIVNEGDDANPETPQSVYLGYMVTVHNGKVYEGRVSADRDLTDEEINQMVDILKSVEFVR